MNNDFKWIADIEQGNTSLIGLIDANRWMEAEMARRRRGFKIGVIAFISVVAAFILFFSVAVLLNPRSSRVDRESAMMFGGILLVVALIFGALFAVLGYGNIFGPYKRYKAALAKAYPGLDTSSEAAIKSYVWTYADDPHVMVVNLCKLILREGEQRKVRGEIGDVYTPIESTVLDVWRTSYLWGELESLEEDRDAELEKLAGAVESFHAVGAHMEAQVWTEVYELFCELKPYSWYVENMPYGVGSVWTRGGDDEDESTYAFTESQRDLMDELALRLDDARPDTEAKLAEYALQHKDEFAFGAA